MIKIFAHRGASGYELENSIEAFKLAILQGADGIELDVQLSRDNNVVVFHDESLKRVFGHDVYVKDLTFKELQTLSNNRICLLEEVLLLVKENGIDLNIELKNNLFDYPGLEKMVYDLVNTYDLFNRVTYSSFNHYSCYKLKKINQNNRVGILFDEDFDNIATYANKIGVDYIHPNYNLLNNDLLFSEARKYNLGINCWTVNTDEDFNRLKYLDLDIVITNYVDRAKKLMFHS